MDGRKARYEEEFRCYRIFCPKVGSEELQESLKRSGAGIITSIIKGTERDEVYLDSKFSKHQLSSLLGESVKIITV
jgi:hypothetical protein